MAKCSKCGETSNPAKAKFCSKCGKEMKSVATKKVETTFENKCHILSELWLDYRQDEQFQDFIEYNDIGLPLSYFVEAEIVQATDIAEEYISETFRLLVVALGLDSNTDWESLNEMLDQANELGTFPRE
jgi:NMD protein affecting ribosome stability and mRNA decay